MPREATVLIVPALRDHVPEHCQTLLASRLPRVDPIGRDNLDCLARIEAIEEAAASTDGTIIIVAHSAASLRSHIGHGLRVARSVACCWGRRQISIVRCRKGTPPWGS